MIEIFKWREAFSSPDKPGEDVTPTLISHEVSLRDNVAQIEKKASVEEEIRLATEVIKANWSVINISLIKHTIKHILINYLIIT